MQRTILHCDLNNFYASVESLDSNETSDKVLVVCGSVVDRHGIVLAKNQKAKQLGITTGMTLNNAKKLCKDLVAVEANMEKYLHYSRIVRKIYQRYTDKIESFGIDEAWLDLTDNKNVGEPFDVALKISNAVKKETGLTISIGISFNKPFAKLASDVKKPDGITIIDESNFQSVVWKMDVSSLLFVGKKVRKTLNELNIFTIGDLANTSPLILYSALGKWAEQLLRFANGTDDSPVIPTDLEDSVKSVSNSVTAYRDLTDNNDVNILAYVLAESIVNRVIDHNYGPATVLAITVKDSNLNSFTRQITLTTPILTVKDVQKVAFDLFKSNYLWEFPVRSFGISLSGFLDKYSDMNSKNDVKLKKLEKTIKKLSDSNGKSVVSSGVSLYDRKLINQKFHDKGITD